MGRIGHGDAQDGHRHAAVGDLHVRVVRLARVLIQVLLDARAVIRVGAGVDDQRVVQVSGQFRGGFGGEAEVPQGADEHHDVAGALLGGEEIADLQVLRQLGVGGHRLALAVAVEVVLAVLAVVEDHLIQRVMLGPAHLIADPQGIAGAVHAIDVVRALAVEVGVLPSFALGVLGVLGVPQGHAVHLLIGLAAKEIGHAVGEVIFNARAGDLVVCGEEGVAVLHHLEGGVQHRGALHQLGLGRLLRQDGQHIQGHDRQQKGDEAFHVAHDRFLS